MDPSSLIFLAIIAIWAAYLVGQWVRRRDQLATARSIDRFSEAMRVLERRTPTRPVSAARPTARSYVVAPVRVPTPGARPARAAGPARELPASPRAAAAATVAGVRARIAGTAGPRSARSARPRITREAARRRARLVLGLVVATVSAWALVAATSLVWWPAALVTTALAAVLVQMRRTARPATSARRRPARRRSDLRPSARMGRRPAGRPSARRRGVASRVPAPARRPRHQEDARSVLDKVSAARRADAVATSIGSDVVTGAVLAPVDVDTLAPIEPAGLALGESTTGDRDGWQPVPVPPPTYTLKPKARPVVRRPVEPVDEAESGSAVDSDNRGDAGGGPRDDVRPATPREPETAAPAFDLDEILERRIASGS